MCSSDLFGCSLQHTRTLSEWFVTALYPSSSTRGVRVSFERVSSLVECNSLAWKLWQCQAGHIDVKHQLGGTHGRLAIQEKLDIVNPDRVQILRRVRVVECARGTALAVAESRRREVGNDQCGRAKNGCYGKHVVGVVLLSL